MDNQLVRTAFHEAGHAVAYAALKMGFSYVTIIPDGDSLGHLKPHKIRKNSWQTLEWLIKETTTSMAGWVAETFHANGKPLEYSGSDWDDIQRRLRSMATASKGELLNENELMPFAEWVAVRTVNLFRLPRFWLSTEMVVERLLQERTLKRAAVLNICDAAHYIIKTSKVD